MIAIRDNLSGGISRCKQISDLSIQSGFSTLGMLSASWSNPSDQKYKGVKIMCRSDHYPEDPLDGVVFYDSNDEIPPTTATKTGLIDNTTYYIRAFAYTYKNATRLYTSSTSGAQATGKPLQVKGSQNFTTSGTFTVPSGVVSIEAFLVGGGGGGAAANGGYASYAGGGGGYTKTYNIPVTPGEVCTIAVGAGGAGGENSSTGYVGKNGGSSSITAKSGTYTALGGYGANGTNTNSGNGGSGGGSSGPKSGTGTPDGNVGGDGGSDGSNGYHNSKTMYNYMVSSGNAQASVFKPDKVTSDKSFSQGQGSTTRAFGDSDGTLYSGGGASACTENTSSAWRGTGGDGGGNGGGYSSGATAGSANTGGGGGSASSYGNSSLPSNLIGKSGGSGIVLIRWGY